MEVGDDSIPWISRDLRWLFTKWDKAYSKWQKSRDPQDKAHHLELKHQGKKLRQEYWKYMGSMVLPDTGEDKPTGSKKMWTYFKQCKTNPTDVAPLKNRRGILNTTSKGKANVLSEQFNSVFSKHTPLTLKFISHRITQKHDISVPDEHSNTSQHLIMPDITITQNMALPNCCKG